jgi:uncharacterized membrane protein YphA (DoxX/SURF4 family)
MKETLDHRDRFQDAGKLVLRLTVGLLVLLHGIPKLMSGAAGIVGLLEKSGLPGFVGYGVLIGEVLAPLLLIAGVSIQLVRALQRLGVNASSKIATARVHPADAPRILCGKHEM